MIRLSIITINYNNASGLEKTIKSVTEQSVSDFEYIIIDGGSNDESLEILNKYNAKITKWVSEKDNGVYNAMNKGIHLANGAYVLFVNSGDYLFSNQVILNSFDYLKGTDLVTFDLDCIGEGQRYLYPAPENLKFSNLYFNTLPHPSTFIKKRLFEEVGLYDETLKIVSDWKFFLISLFKYDCSYVKVNQVLTVFSLDGISSMQDFSEERKKVLQEYFPQFIEDYTSLGKYRSESSSNGYKLLVSIEKNKIGKKILSILYKITTLFVK